MAHREARAGMVGDSSGDAARAKIQPRALAGEGQRQQVFLNLSLFKKKKKWDRSLLFLN